MSYKPSFPVLRGLLSMLCGIINTIIWCVPLFAVTALRVIPIAPWQRLCTAAATQIAMCWIDVNRLWLRVLQPKRWHTQVDPSLSMERWYLVTANHQSWADILIVQTLLNRKIPLLKFFLKQQLIWVPILGLCWWALDFPFMKRYSKDYLQANPSKKGKDLEATKKACEKFQYLPTSVFNFMEGTRFTPEKHAQKSSPFNHLLPPKAGGVGFVLGSMGSLLEQLVDVTIVYPDGRPTFWQFLCGYSANVEIDIAVRDIPEHLKTGNYLADDTFREEVQQWVNELWLQKDARFGALLEKAQRESSILTE